MPNWEGGSGTGYEGGPSTGRNNSGGTGNQNKSFDPFSGWGFWDRFGAGSTVGLPLGPVGSLLAGVMAGATAFADPGGSISAPLGSVSGGRTGSETSRAIADALAAPTPAPVAPVAPIAPSLGEADKKRKRIGRQETILTSRSSLSDTSTAQPTLLGQ